ncbi:MAG: DNA polymerase III subunit chi [Alphaproteobacteria bacterium]|nr:DNA polymerase III subunit chi [Alphaproteobacteria bacterium]
MTDIGFYHLTKTPLEQALLRLLEKAVEAGNRVVVRSSSEERVAFLNGALWTNDAASFLPHGTKNEGNAECHPVWLTSEIENPIAADVLVLTDGADTSSYENYKRCLEIFDGNDEQSVMAARERWKTYKEADCSLTYWQQNDRGGWEKKGE